MRTVVLCVLFLLFLYDSEGQRDKLSSVSRMFPRPYVAAPSFDSANDRLATNVNLRDDPALLESFRLYKHSKNSVELHRNLQRNAAATNAEAKIFAANGATAEKRVNGTCSSTDDVHALLDDIVCSKNYLKSLVSAGKKCNLFGYFDSDHVRSCGVDSNGTFCRKYEREFPDPDYLAWYVLQQCSLQTTTGKCSSNCKKSLANFAAKFGCCIHVSRVSWFAEDNPHILILSSALWTFCGLTRPKPCGNVPSLPSSTIAGPCTYGCYAYARSTLICEGAGAQLIDTYNRCGRKGSALELGQLCGLNDKGTACFELQFTDNTDYLLSIYTACFKYFSTGACTDKCTRTLQRFRSKYGCCVNVYNGTAFGDSSQLLGSIVTSYALWSSCGVTSPGMCTLPSEVESGNHTYNVAAFCDNLLTGGAIGSCYSDLSLLLRVICLSFIVTFIHSNVQYISV